MKKNDHSVFYISLGIVILVSLFGIIVPKTFGIVANKAFAFLTEKFGWFYLVSMFVFVLFMGYLIFSKYGNIKLGDDNSEPDYSYMAWFSMLFSAGMGIGLVFWGVAEPLNHYLAPMGGILPATTESGNFAISSSFMHWGIHPWASYATIALPLAYMQFRKKKPALISSIFIPLIGEDRVNGPIGKTIDVLAIFATVAGVATSLGLGVLQINSGLNYLFGIPINSLVNGIIIAVVTVLFMISAMSGLNKGILILSNSNVIIGFILMILTFILGPTLPIVNSLVNGLGSYISGFVNNSLSINPFGGNSWISSWRIFYWAWWIAWAPFVGSFIARISKGRTIKEFILGVTIIPAFGSFVWFSVFGTTGISLGPEIAAEAIEVTETALFVIMEHLPFGGLISMVAILLLGTFFITSADSATFVLGMMSRNGNLNPGNRITVIWGLVQSLMAFSLMLAGGLEVLQTGSIVAAFPFAFIMLLGCFSFLKALKEEELDLIKK